MIHFTSFRAGSSARVTLTDGSEVIVRAPVGAASFTTNDDRLVIENAGVEARFEVEIPRTAPHVEIQIAGKHVFTKDGQSILPRTALQSGPYVIPLVRPES